MELRRTLFGGMFIPAIIVSAAVGAVWAFNAIHPWDATIGSAYVGSDGAGIGVLICRKGNRIPVDIECPYWLLIVWGLIIPAIRFAFWLRWRAKIAGK